MTASDDPLTALWAATEAPARDLEFELAVEQRIARRGLLIDMAGYCAAAAAGTAALWAVLPAAAQVFGGLSVGFNAAGPVMVAAAAAAAAAVWLMRPLEEA